MCKDCVNGLIWESVHRWLDTADLRAVALVSRTVRRGIGPNGGEVGRRARCALWALARIHTLQSPCAIAYGAGGALLIGCSGSVRRVSDGVIATVAGTGIVGYGGDGGPGE
eukprot:gene15690-8370_t